MYPKPDLRNARGIHHLRLQGVARRRAGDADAVEYVEELSTDLQSSSFPRCGKSCPGWHFLGAAPAAVIAVVGG